MLYRRLKNCTVQYTLLPTYPAISLSVCLSVYLSRYVSRCLSVCRSICLSTCCISASLSVSVSIYPSMCLSIHLYVFGLLGSVEATGLCVLGRGCSVCLHLGSRDSGGLIPKKQDRIPKTSLASEGLPLDIYYRGLHTKTRVSVYVIL